VKIGVLAISLVLFAAGTIADEESSSEQPLLLRSAAELPSGEPARMPWVGENDAAPLSAVNSYSQIESQITSAIPAIEEVDASDPRHN